MTPHITELTIETWDTYMAALAAHERLGTPASLTVARHAGEEWKTAFLAELPLTHVSDDRETDTGTLQLIEGGRK